jgi:hypothetical protein
MQRLGGALGRLSGLGSQQAPPVLNVELAEQQQEQRHSSQPQLISQGHTRAGSQQEERPRGSSGAGLPSALSTPRLPPGRTSIASQAAAAQQDDDTPDSPGSQQQAQEETALEPAITVSRQQPRGVRWLPGLQAAGNPPGTADAAPAAPATEGADAGAASSKGRLGANSASSGSSQRPLPPSGDEQLDKYLAYLLREQRHSFLFYPEWGMSEEACAALAAFLRRDRRIKAMTLGGNSISDEGGWTGRQHGVGVSTTRCCAVLCCAAL